jgi:hypothetical protein
VLARNRLKGLEVNSPERRCIFARPRAEVTTDILLNVGRDVEREDLQTLHLKAWYFREAPLVACRDGIIFGDSSGADHEVAFAYRNATLGQVGPQGGVYPRHGEIESDDRKPCEQPFHKGLAPMALGRGPCPVKPVQQLRGGHRRYGISSCV